MQVNRLVIHQLEKESKIRGIKLYNSSSDLVPLHDGINKMYSIIHESFEKDKTRHGKFKVADTTNSVMTNILRYTTNGNDSDEVFMTFTKASLDNLATRIQNETLATGGYYLFGDYEVNGNRFVSIIIVRKKDGFNIEWSGAINAFDLTDTQNINIEKLAMGFRLNMGLYDQRLAIDRNYIAILTNQGDALSNYFVEWVNVTGMIDGKIHSSNFVDAVKSLGPPNPDTDPVEFEKEVHEFITSYKKVNKGKINIDKVSEHFYGDPLTIRGYIEEKLQKEIDPDFIFDTQILKKLIQIKAEVKGISVSIESSKFSSQEVEIVDGMLVIRNVELVNKIKSQQEA